MRRMALLAGLAGAAVLAMPVAARDPDRVSGSGAAQDRLDRDTQRAAARADELAARYAAERSRIEQRAAQDPDKAAGDLAKLDADLTREKSKLAEDQAKDQADFTERSAKEAEDAAKRLAEQGDDSSSDRAEMRETGSSEQIRDLGEAEGAEHDERGFPVRRGEVVGIDLSPATLERAKDAGFGLIEQRSIQTLDSAVTRLRVPAGLSATEARDRLRAIDPTATVDVVHYYGLNLTAGGRGHRVAHKGSAAGAPATPGLAMGMIDTGVAPHQALRGVRLVAWPAGQLPAAPVDHGTAVASLLQREGASTIYTANIFRGTAARPFTSADVIADALEWMVANRLATINMSLAGPRNAILDRLIQAATARGIQVIAAAGNGGPAAPPAYPAAVPGVIAVTAVDHDGRIYRYANHGSYIAVAARGVDVVAARAEGGFATFAGTSFATPHVTGWISRCRLSGKEPRDCTQDLRRSARDLGPTGFDPTYGYGLID